MVIVPPDRKSNMRNKQDSIMGATDKSRSAMTTRAKDTGKRGREDTAGASSGNKKKAHTGGHPPEGVSELIILYRRRGF